MPTATQGCTEPGCGELVRRPGRCRRHSSERERYAGWRAERVGPNWEGVRATVLREERWCRHCGMLAQEVDHILPISQHGTSERANLQALCRDCHRAKTLSQT